MIRKFVRQGYRSVLTRVNKTTASHGFLLPVVIALGLGIGTVSVTALRTVAQNSTTLNTQYFSQVAREAAQAGVAAATNCIKTKNPLPTAWTTNNPLKPDKDCDILSPSGSLRTPYVDDNAQYRSTYSVIKPTYQDSNNTSMLITSTGKVLVKTANGGTAVAAEVTVHGYGVFPANNVIVPTNYKPVKSLSAGPSTVCSIATDPATNSDWAYCWGSNSDNMLGTGKVLANNRSTSPIAVAQSALPAVPAYSCGFFCTVPEVPAVPANPMIGKKVTKISVGVNHVCAIATDSNGTNTKVYCWGNNTYGQLGNNSTTSSSVPVEVDTTGALPAVPAVPAQGCGFFGCAVPAVPEVPAKLTSAIQNKTIVDITAGENFTCALNSLGNVACWGLNDNGQLGTGNRTTYTYPVAVDNTYPGAPGVPGVPGVPGYVCGFFCYVPEVPAIPAIPAVPPSGLLGKTVKKLAQLKGGATMCVITNTSNPVCWGQNYAGQVGNGQNAATGSTTQGTCTGGNAAAPAIPITTSSDAIWPTAVQTNLLFDSLSINSFNSSTGNLSGTSDGTSTNSSYVMGRTASNSPSNPGRMYWWGGSTTLDIDHRICSGGGGAGAGNNKYQNTNTRTYTSQSTPAGPLYNSGTTTINGSPLAIFSGNPKTGLFCAGLSTNSTQLYCDANGTSIAEGQTGDGYSPCTNFLGFGCPALPTGVRTVTMTALGGEAPELLDTGTSGYTCAVTTKGEVFCWGNNASGQLGVIPASNRNIPAPVDINLTTSALYSSGAGSGSGTTYSAYTLKAIY